jgi:Flp pilus assembly pilin Flp
MKPFDRSKFRRTVVGNEEGQTMAEYGVVLSVICVATVGVFTLLSGSISAAVGRAVALIPK